MPYCTSMHITVTVSLYILIVGSAPSFSLIYKCRVAYPPSPIHFVRILRTEQNMLGVGPILRIDTGDSHLIGGRVTF